MDKAPIPGGITQQEFDKLPFGNTKVHFDHYMEVYHEHLSKMKDDRITLLELGVAEGKSLLYWRDGLPQAGIVGLDIRQVEIDDPTGRIKFYVGEQQDRGLLDRIAAEVVPDGFDVIIDDASHNGQLTRISFWHLLQHHLKPGGLYFVEDGGTYWDRSPDGRRYVPRPRWILHGRRR